MHAPTFFVYFLLLLAVLSSARAEEAQLLLVRAGNKFEDIATLSWDKMVKICPEKYATGFSIRCDGSGMSGPVEIAAQGGYIRVEGRAPFHIAGDNDSSGLTRIFPWKEYESLCNRNKPCYLRVWCTYLTEGGRRNGILKPLTIQPLGCSIRAKSEYLIHQLEHQQ